ncbi:curli-like amyloid fiber formation chaperone CsgH [Hymenobacter rubripertinctus]|uniref:Curli assembly protein CsgC n=1 Tax=Hymenobacter rubripertinctus TaxID=2029981 RepID=A0A418QZC9_9BACT|nr:curli-like amyloid fiber formation chaperone CsgH [Hymenobacter rubripertinctus]RIY10498.1 hypothetical protein D0T11_09880 [Hymenobacter rubripertinctus]
MYPLLFVLLTPLAGMWPQPTGPCQARLDAQRTGELLTLVGHCQNTSDQPMEVRYEMVTDKRGAAGTSHNAQSGYVTVAARESGVLSQSTMNVGEADHYAVHLRLFGADNRLLAQDSLIRP